MMPTRMVLAGALAAFLSVATGARPAAAGGFVGLSIGIPLPIPVVPVVPIAPAPVVVPAAPCRAYAYPAPVYHGPRWRPAPVYSYGPPYGRAYGRYGRGYGYRYR